MPVFAAASLAAALLAAAAAPAPARAAETNVRREVSSTFQNVVVRPGDTLWGISHAYLQDPTKWDEILKYNRLPTSDPTVALPGMTLRVPIRLIKTSLRAAHVVYLVNQVRYRHKDTAEWKGAKMRMEIYQGDTLRTFEDSKARVMFLNNELLNLDQNSMAVIKPPLPDADVELKLGSVFAGRARVVTATARVIPRTRDTRYSASVDANMTTRVEVFKGVAAVAAQGASIDVPAGMETRVSPGLAPEPPRPLAAPVELEARAREFASAAAVGGVAVSTPRVPTPRPGPDADGLRADIRVLGIGQPIQGYHVQASAEREFRKVLFDRRYAVDERFSAQDSGLKPGAYWWRVAPVDLLGAEGRFGAPRYYKVGIKRVEP